MAIEQERNWHARAFFGLHYDLHAGEKDTVLGRDLTHESLRAALEVVKPDFVQCDCKGHPGYTSYPTRVGTPSPGIVKDALRIHRDVTREMGIPLSVHYSGVWDGAAVARHPEWARIGPDGSPSDRMTCPNSGYTRELMIPQLLELVAEYDIDGIWVDGENWASAPCYCPRCRDLFRQRTGCETAPASKEEAHWAEWLAFHRDCFAEHVRQYADAVHAVKPTCMVCSNWMYSVRQPDEVSVPVDYLSGDFTWAYGPERAAAEGRFLDSRGMPWDLMAWTFNTCGPGMTGWTTKTLPHLCQEVAVVLANGGAVFLYDTPQRNGHLVGWHQQLFGEVARFCRERQEVSQGTVSVPQAAVLHSAAHFYAHNDPLFNLGSASHPMEGALHALLENHFPVDILNEETLTRRLAEYPLVVVAEQTGISPELVTALEQYVREGGHLLLSGAHVAETFGALAGVAPEGEPIEGLSYLPCEGRVTTVAGPWQPVRLVDAEPLLPLMAAQEFGKDELPTPAATLRRLGKGSVVAVHGPLFADYYRTHYPGLRGVVRDLCAALAPERMVELDAPATLELSLRRKGDRLLLHLVNQGCDAPLSPRRLIIENVPPIGPVGVRVRLPQAPSRVSLAPKDEGVQWSWADGVLTATIAQVGIHDILVIE